MSSFCFRAIDLHFVKQTFMVFGSGFLRFVREYMFIFGISHANLTTWRDAKIMSTTYCNTMHHTAMYIYIVKDDVCLHVGPRSRIRPPVATQICLHNTLQHIATHCIALQYICVLCKTKHVHVVFLALEPDNLWLRTNAFTTHCNTLQHTASRCNMYLHCVGRNTSTCSFSHVNPTTSLHAHQCIILSHVKTRRRMRKYICSCFTRHY